MDWNALDIYILQLLWSQEESYNLTDLSVFDGVSSVLIQLIGAFGEPT